VTSWFEAVAAPAPKPATKRSAAKPRPKAKAAPAARPNAKRRSRPHGAIAWIVISAALLAGVVFVNLAVLRLNLQLDAATSERAKLRGENAGLASDLSSALASPRIQSQARRDGGLVDADPAAIGYIDLAR
jgi:hypothetical protein